MKSGKRIGRYRLLNRIGMGGMAEVFMAEESLPEGGTRIVAVKRLLPKLSAEHEFVGMFVNEARIASSMAHPNIVSVYDMINFGSYYYIVMEYLEGLDLEELVSHLDTGPPALSLGEIAFIVHEVAQGLFYAHQGGVRPEEGPVVHRDISPGNILVDKKGRVKITDFGIARALQYAGFTRPGVLKGKYEYMAPEYVEGKDFDGRADLFSLGVVLYELLAGESPFAAVLPGDIWDRIVRHDPPRPSRLVKSIPRSMDAVVARVLQKNPKRRVQNGEDLASHMTAFFSDQGRENLAASLGRRVAKILTKRTGPITTQSDIDSFLPPGDQVTEHTQEIHLDEMLELVEVMEVPQLAFGDDVSGMGNGAIPVGLKSRRTSRWKRRLLAVTVGALALLLAGTLLWLLWPHNQVGYLSVVSDLKAIVFVDGRRIGLAPLRKHPLKQGTHRVTVRRTGRGLSKRYTRTIVSGKHTLIRIEWRRQRPKVSRKRKMSSKTSLRKKTRDKRKKTKTKATTSRSVTKPKKSSRTTR